MTAEEYESFCRERYNEILRYVKRHLGVDKAEDVTQEVFFIAWKRREAVLASKKPVGWLYNTAKNLIREARKKDARHSFAPFEDCTEVQGNGKMELELVEWKMILEEWMEPGERKLFMEHYVNGISVRELAMREDVKEEVLRMRLHRMKKRLTQKVKELKIRE